MDAFLKRKIPDDNQAASNETKKTKIENCPHATKCYRRNPHHFKEYDHPHLEEFLEKGEPLELPPDYPQQKQVILEQLEVLRGLRNIKPAVKKVEVSVPINGESSRQSTRKKATSFVPNSSQTVINSNGKTMLQMLEDNAPYNLFFTTIPDSVETTTHKNAITFTNLLCPSLGDLKCSLQLNFMIDIAWLMEQYKKMGQDTTYSKYFENNSKNIQQVMWESFKVAGEEEARLAKEEKSVDEDGTPIISVIVDGAWCKRSYRTNYNALSGVACVVGAKTKKILFLGVRNKYCVICNKHETAKHQSPDHICYKNWDKSSTAMESDIILEAFKLSKEMHGVIYGRLVVDGDSNVYSKLLNAAPYGPTFHIRKIECKNHLKRNYVTKLTELKSNTSLPIECRKLLECRIETLRVAVSMAVKYWIAKDDLFTTKTICLKQDILNAPHHIFGDHKNCCDYYCTDKKRSIKIQNGEVNFIPKLKESRMYYEIMNCTQRIADNAWSLLHNVDTNIVECYNSILAKFIGGKRINFALKGSYATRSYAAALSFNSSVQYHSAIQNTFGDGLGQYTTKYLETIKKRKIQNKKANVPKKKRVEKIGPDVNYGLNLEEYPDMNPEVYEQCKAQFLQKLNNISYTELERDTREQCTSVLWVQERKLRLTASNFGRISSMKPTTSTVNAVTDILYSRFTGNSSTEYGHQHEAIAIKQFENTYGFKTKKIGLCVIKEYPFLGASPDRILDNESAIIEVKCPSSCRNLTPVEGVRLKKILYCKLDVNNKLVLKDNHNYMAQIQGQLSITNKDLCYFIVWTPQGMSVEVIKRNEVLFAKIYCKLEEFYYNALLPELLDSRRTRNLPLREYYLQKKTSN